MTNARIKKKVETARRKLLKTVMIGSGAITAGKLMPTQWTRPVVASVMLPAHARSTTDCTLGTFGFPIDDTLTVGDGSLFNSLFSGPFVAGTFTVTGEPGSPPCTNGTAPITVTGTVDGTFYAVQNIYCDGSQVGSCIGTGTVSANTISIPGSVFLSGAATCTACDYLIFEAGP